MAEALINLVVKYLPRSSFVSYFLPTVIGAFALIFFFPFASIKLFEFPLSKILSLTLLEIILPLAMIYWLAYMLENNSSGTLEFFKGRYLPSFISRPMIARQYKRLRRQRAILDHYQQLNRRLEENLRKKEADTAEILEMSYVREKLVSDVIQIGSIGLLRHEDVFPTRLGNVFRAIDYYPKERYGIDNQVIWPKLFQLISPELKTSLKEVIDNLFFFLNSSLVLYALAFISLFGGLLRVLLNTAVGPQPGTSALTLVLTRILEKTDSNTFGWNAEYSYFAFSLVLFLAGYILYRFSLITAGDYAYSVRSVYDLHRFELLRKMNIATPNNLQEEQALWSKVSEFLGVGRAFDPINLEYSRTESAPGDKTTKAEAIDFDKVIFPNSQRDVSSPEKAIHVDLGGITLNVGDLLKDVAALVKSNAATSRKKKVTSRKASSKKRRDSTSKKSPIDKPLLE